jgi:hypothetical protein
MVLHAERLATRIAVNRKSCLPPHTFQEKIENKTDLEGAKHESRRLKMKTATALPEFNILHKRRHSAV